MTSYWRHTGILLAGLLAVGAARAAEPERGTVIREANMYVTPDPNAARVGTATRGRDIPTVIERTTIDGKPWAKVLATVDTSLPEPKEISGWIESRLLVTTTTPSGDQIIYGEAVDSERQAEQRGGRRHAAEDAMRLYYRLYEYFPNSPLAGEALWRAADIRWQLEKSGIILRPSSQERDPEMREHMDDETMKLIMKKFPHSKWADLASYEMIDNKVCGEWKGEASCPEKESDMYEKYAREHPQSPKAAEALYNAAWRQAALVDIYRSNRQQDKSEHARKKSLDLAQEIASRFPEGDWKPRAANLVYALQQNIPMFGNANAESSR